MNLKQRGFTEFTSLTLLLQLDWFSGANFLSEIFPLEKFLPRKVSAGNFSAVYQYGEDMNLNPRIELNGQSRLALNPNLNFSVIMFIDRQPL